ncbi:MAG: glycoside hydrolase family 2 protein [Halanaerobiales bacterium]
MEELTLDSGWKLREEPLSTGINLAPEIAQKKKGWIKGTVPGDIHIDLIRENIIPEPLEGLNSFECEWIEDKSWWYSRKFETKKDWLQADKVELELNGLDSRADIFINDIHLGHHLSTFRPFIVDIKDLLNPEGEKNCILVRLTTGVEYFSDDDISEIAPYISVEKGNRGDKRRAYVRKPQYTFGWDWNPRVATCGITGEVKIRPIKQAVIRNVKVDSVLDQDNDLAKLRLKVELESLDWIGTTEGQLEVEITDEKDQTYNKEQEVFLRSGKNYINFNFDIENPRLWWPNDMGEQHRYSIIIKGKIEGEEISYPEFKYGLRTVELDQRPINEDERLFVIKINGVRTYCRGANWIPADSIYGRITGEKYQKLIEEAATANFTMLRIWGGGLYEKECFYEFCEREGIMVWQDFMFSCAAYPDMEEWFVEEVKKEVEYQTKRLRNHSCIVLWSGSNENNWGFRDWWNRETKGGARIYNDIIPELVNKNSPDIPYWNGSPYGGEAPNSTKIGDRHHWHDCMMNEKMEKRITPQEYNKVDSKFISEYGYIGPSIKESIQKYLGDEPFNRNGEAWQHHNNTFEKDTVIAGIEKHYKDSDNLSDDEYLLYAGLCQGMMYEYSLDSFRSRLNCSGGLFWMYNDCWGEVGWTIVDYYLNRKISYHFVRRANAPIRIILRKRDNKTGVIITNDTETILEKTLEYGYISFDGKIKETKEKKIKISPYSRNIVIRFPQSNFIKKSEALKSGFIFARIKEDNSIDTAIFKADDFRNLNVLQPKLEITDFEVETNKTVFNVKTDNYAHAVHFNLPSDYKLSDEYFDLLPEEEKKIIITGKKLSIKEIKPKAVMV